MSCALCETRKEKRFCPAAHGRICPTCCGQQREVTLDCPSDCVYLQQARRNERPRPESEVDREVQFPAVEISQGFLYERESLLVGLTYALAKCARLDRLLNDRDLIAALTSLAKTYQTLVGSGLVYEQPTASPMQQNVVAEVQKMVAEYRATEQKHVGYSTLRDGDILKAVVFLLRMALTRTSGRPKSRVFLDFLFAQFPEKEGVIAAPQAAGSSIILP